LLNNCALDFYVNKFFLGLSPELINPPDPLEACSIPPELVSAFVLIFS